MTLGPPALENTAWAAVLPAAKSSVPTAQGSVRLLDPSNVSINFSSGPVQVPGWEDVVGDSVVATASTAAYGKTVSNWVWSVAGGAVQSQSWSQQQGTTTPLPANVTHDALGSTSDLLSFFWDQNPTQKTVTATANYTDGSSDSNSVTVQLVAPTVDWFKDQYTINYFQAYNNLAFIGFDQAQVSGNTTIQGNNFSASVSTPAAPINSDGQFAFLQFINASLTRKFLDKSTQTLSSSRQFVLDDFPGAPYPGVLFVNTYISDTIQAGAQSVLIPPNGSATLATDSPVFSAAAANYPNGNYITTLAYNSDQLETDLVYKPTNGIWVGLSKINWGLGGNATYNGAPASYTDPNSWSNWKQTQSPSSPDTYTGTNSNFMPRDWTDYWSNQKWN